LARFPPADSRTIGTAPPMDYSGIVHNKVDAKLIHPDANALQWEW
jgi:hypothetical protein